MQPIVLSDFELGEVLGVGTVGTIYAAKNRETGQVVAVKKLHPAVSQDPTIRARFQREMLVLSRLQHPNIIAYHGGGDDNGMLFYVMELVDGGTVKDLLESRGTFGWPVTVELARQICSALQYAHNHGVIHRDLKPGNLFLTRDGEVKLGDFGIARDLRNSDLTSSGMTVGTHAYMAPEQITGDASISGKADLYALGCCLYEMMTGKKVFNGENFAQLFEQHLRTPPPHVRDSIPDCPPELDQVIVDLLAKRSEERPFNARKVQAVMLQLDETYHTHDLAADVTFDIPADEVVSRGRQILVEQIRGRVDVQPTEPVSWTRLVVVGVLIFVGVLVASMASR